ncbi:MAG: YIP1 family protein [Calditrichaceae bacterium]|jgi:hypothetical protein
MEGEEKIKSMNALSKAINIFVSPREAFESINEKPTWLFPYIIITVFVLFMMFMTKDLQTQDQINAMRANGMTEQQLDNMESNMRGPLGYIGFVIAPAGMLIVNLVIAALLLVAANLMIGEKEISYKKIFSMLMWAGLVGIISVLISTFLAMQKGTMIGISLDLSALLPAVPPGESKSFLYRLLARFDIFVFWQMALWVIGLSVMYKTTIKKAIAPVATLWVIWVIIAVGLGGVIGKFVPGM